MKKLFGALLVVVLVTGCTTPKVMMKDDRTGQIVSCGGSATGSMMGGVIGYHMQKSNDKDCESDYKAQGFHRIGSAPGSTGHH